MARPATAAFRAATVMERIPGRITKSHAELWRTHSCVPRRDFLDACSCANFSRRRHEWRRGTQECVRHIP